MIYRHDNQKNVRRTSQPTASSALQAKYRWTAPAYDILDYYWERQYRKWRPEILADLTGDVLELGVGTGRNLEFYSSRVRLVAVDLSPHMLARAARGRPDARYACSRGTPPTFGNCRMPRSTG